MISGVPFASTVLVRGLGDIASAVAHRLLADGYSVAIHNGADPPRTHRRSMSFADSFFDGRALLDGIEARRLEDIASLAKVLRRKSFVPIMVQPFDTVLHAVPWVALVDARMRKRAVPEAVVLNLDTQDVGRSRLIASVSVVIP